MTPVAPGVELDTDQVGLTRPPPMLTLGVVPVSTGLDPVPVLITEV